MSWQTLLYLIHDRAFENVRVCGTSAARFLRGLNGTSRERKIGYDYALVRRTWRADDSARSVARRPDLPAPICVQSALGGGSSFVAFPTNVTKAFRLLVPLLKTSIGAPVPCPFMAWPTHACFVPSGVIWPEPAGEHVEGLGTSVCVHWQRAAGRHDHPTDAQ